LPPQSKLEIRESAIILTNPLVEIVFDFEAPGGGSFMKPGGGSEVPALADGKGQFITSFVGLNITSTFSGIRSQNRKMEKYKDWAKGIVEGAQEWFD
jgi:hypothetical protein